MIETKRLKLRPLTTSDHGALCVFFGDKKVMKSSNSGTKSSEEVELWLIAQIEGAKNKNGIELLAVNGKFNNEFIGYCGLTLFPEIDGATEIEIGYRLIRKFWNHGYATEATRAVRDYAFLELKLSRIVALIEPVNIRSINVAKKIGMTYEKDVMLKDYDYPDHLYSMRNRK